MNKRVFSPLDQSEILWLREYQEKHELCTAHLAERVGLPRQTFRECMAGGPTKSTTRDKIAAFISQEKSGLGSPAAMPAPTLTGSEVPKLGAEKLLEMKSRLDVGLEIITRELVKILEADAGTRVHFQEIARGPLSTLFALSRAIQNDGLRDRVLGELREHGITSFNQLLQRGA